MSRQAIAAVLARTDLASGERLVALSLASFAGRENRAWPGAPAASARAGLSRSRYQQAREQMVARGLLASTSVPLAVAERARSLSCSLTPVRGGTVTSTSAVRGGPDIQPGPRTRAAAPCDDGCLADKRGDVCDLSTEQLCVAAGIADRPYRRARSALLASGRWTWSTASAAVGTQTCGPCATRARAATPAAPNGHGGSRRRPARGRWWPGEFASTRRSGRRRPTKRAVAIGQFRPRSVLS